MSCFFGDAAKSGHKNKTSCSHVVSGYPGHCPASLICHPSSIHRLPCGPGQCCLARTHTSVEGKSPLPPSAVLHLSHRLGLPCWSSFGSTATSAVFPIHLFLVSFIHSPFHLLGTEKVSSDSLIALTDFCMVIDFT